MRAHECDVMRAERVARSLPCSGSLMWLGSGWVGMPLLQREARARIGKIVTPAIMVKAIANSM